MSKCCKLCRYVLADPIANSCEYHCLCEESPLFGESLGIRGEGPGCGHYKATKYEDMSLLEALKIITCSKEHSGYPTFFHRKNREDDTHPFLAITFETNAQLENWREANIRLFTEVMRLRQENGEFEEENDGEKTGNSSRMG